MPTAFTLFLDSESGAFTIDWMIQFAIVAAISISVLSTLSANRETRTSGHTEVRGTTVTVQYP